MVVRPVFEGEQVFANGAEFISVFNITKSDPTLALSVARYNQEKHFGNNIVAVNREQITKYLMEGNIPYSKTFADHIDCVNSVAFSPDGNQILAGSNDSTANMLRIRMWAYVTKIFRSFGHHQISGVFT